ncbi:MAG: ATP-binding protein [Candidatus Saccharibacteria bacterium]|nr:ATP-binding protein [Candidatus Saccharibacteria bacterium]
MSKTKQISPIDPSSKRGFLGYAIPIYATLTMVAIVFLAARNYPVYFSFRFNAYALLSLISIISSVVLVVLISRIRTDRGNYLTWFGLYLASVGLWGVGEFFNRLAANVVAAQFWSGMSTIGVAFLPPTLFLFAYNYVYPERGRRIPLILSLILTCMLFVFIDPRTILFNLYDNQQISTKPWGLDVPFADYYPLLLLWVVSLLTATLVLFVRYYRRVYEPLLRRQVKLFIIGYSIPFVIGFTTEGWLPLIGVFIMPSSVLVLAIVNATVTYSIIRYKFFTFTPASIAENILNTMNEAVIGVGSDMTVNYLNKVAELWLGFNATKHSNNIKLTEIFPKSWSVEEIEEQLVKPLSQQDYSHIESVEFRRVDGSEFVGKVTASRVVHEKQVQGYIIVITDITQLARTKEIIEQTVEQRTRELNESRAQLLATIKSLPFGFAVINENDNVIISNTQLAEIVSEIKPGAFADSTSVLSLIAKHFEEAADIVDFIKTVRENKLPTEKNIELGSKFYRLLFIPILDLASQDSSKILGTAMIVEDTTEVKALQRSRDEFFSIASHELRTPLTTIRGNTRMILDMYKEAVKDPEVHQMVDDIYGSSVHLIDVVNEFLDMSRLEQRKIDFKTKSFDVMEVINKLVREHEQNEDKSKDIKVEVKPLDKAVTVFGDVDRVAQIIGNLFDNALKFTEKGSVTIEATVHDAGLVKIFVTDTGKGIPVGSQHLLFHKFQQASDNILTRDYTRSTGLGLYISRLLANGMNGNLYLEISQEGKGSTFVLELPSQPPQTADLSAPMPLQTVGN